MQILRKYIQEGKISFLPYSLTFLIHNEPSLRYYTVISLSHDSIFFLLFFQKYFYATFLNNSYMKYVSGQGLQMLFLYSCHLSKRSNSV
jgi:hypothetical protein